MKFTIQASFVLPACVPLYHHRSLNAKSCWKCNKWTADRYRDPSRTPSSSGGSSKVVWRWLRVWTKSRPDRFSQREIFAKKSSKLMTYSTTYIRRIRVRALFLEGKTNFNCHHPIEVCILKLVRCHIARNWHNIFQSLPFHLAANLRDLTLGHG